MELYIVAYRDDEGELGIIINLTLEELKLFVEAYENGDDDIFIDGRKYIIQRTTSIEIFNTKGWHNLNDPSVFIQNSYNGYLRNEDFYQNEILQNGLKVTKQFINKPYGFKKVHSEKKTLKSMKKTSSPRIFISHSTKDLDIVNAFIDKIMILSFGLTREQIFCSSVTGTGIKSGDDFRNAIKEELQNADAVFQIISKDYKQSEVCLNEMGAAWMLTDTIVPLVIPPQNYDVGFLNCSTQQLKINDEQNLHKLYNDYKGVLFPDSIDTGVFNEKIKEFIFYLNSYLHQRQGNTNETNFFYHEQVEINGLFGMGIYAGPPGYGETLENDSHHRYSYIELSTRVNVLSGDSHILEEGLRNFSHFGIDKIHLVFQDYKPTSPLKMFCKKQVLVRGEIFEAKRGWHQTKVLIRVTSLEIV